VSAPLSSGSVVAPLHMVPHADDAVASLGSVSPARRRVQPARRRCSGGEVGHPPAGRSRVFFRLDLHRFSPFLPLTGVDLWLGWPDLFRFYFTSPNPSKI
jgi:hypothetical protein